VRLLGFPDPTAGPPLNRRTTAMPADRAPNPEDTARIDLRELEASADEAERLLLLMNIGAAEYPTDVPSTPTPTTR
jgi:hypothetical protein